MQFGAAKGAFAQTKRGALSPWGDIPARPFFGFEEPQVNAISDILADWLEGLTR